MSKRLNLAVALLVIALLAAACGGGGSQQSSNTISSGSASTSSGSGATIQVSLQDFRFAPATITVQRGQTVTITLKNDGAVAHDFRIEGLNVSSQLLRPGQTQTITFTPNQAGQFTIICTEPGHEASGMRGTLVVQG